jgi:coenzyme F420-0:L-glutamate ligase/coenzyme F420-1:gamma-L-glutamate ligase
MSDSVELDSLQDLIRSRRTVRRFLPKAVPPELIIQIIETATWSPSAHNRQPWQFLVLGAGDKRIHVVRHMGNRFRQDLLADGISENETEQAVQRARERVLTAPVAIMVCLDTSLGDTYPDQRRKFAEYIMGVQSVAMAGCTLLLAAHAAGLGGVWLCSPLFAPEQVRSVLDLPDEWDPQGLILLGYPARIPEARPRQSVEKVSRFY